MTVQTEGPWRAEVLVFNEIRWATNALRFNSESEALTYAIELRGRWMLVDKVRAVPDATPLSEAYEPGSEQWVVREVAS